MSEFEKIVGAKIIYADHKFILVEKDGEKLVVTPYCACHSGFWELGVDSPYNKGLPSSVREKLRQLKLI